VTSSLITTPYYYDVGLPTGSVYYYKITITQSGSQTTDWTPIQASPTITSGLKDSDGDGFEDLVEIRANTDPNSAASQPPSGFPYNSTGDLDGDHYKDFYEYELGFDPSSASSHPDLGNLNTDTAVTGADAIILKRIAVGTLSMNSFNVNGMDLN